MLLQGPLPRAGAPPKIRLPRRWLLAASVRSMIVYLAVALGGAIGSVSRFWLNGLVSSHVGEAFPWGTLVINVTGSFVIGFFATLTAPDGRVFAGTTTRQFVMTGICGGYTTFSSFSLQTLELVRSGAWMRAGGYTVASFVACLLAVWLGHLCAQAINSSNAN